MFGEKLLGPFFLGFISGSGSAEDYVFCSSNSVHLSAHDHIHNHYTY